MAYMNKIKYLMVHVQMVFKVNQNFNKFVKYSSKL